MQQSTDNSMANANAAMNARSTAASTSFDFALNQQNCLNTTTAADEDPNQITPGEHYSRLTEWNALLTKALHVWMPGSFHMTWHPHSARNGICVLMI